MQTQTPTPVYQPGPWYFVRSRTNNDLFHALDTRDDGTLRCYCPDYRFNRKGLSPCFHVEEAAAGRALVATPKRVTRPTFRLAIPGETVESFGFLPPADVLS
jgi:hypothetical protein